jgi:ribonuclease P protein component
MIAAKYRFHGHGSLNYLFRNGKTARNSRILVRSVGNKRRETSRVSVIVSKKIAKSAVVRNRIRRRIYEVVRNNWVGVAPQTDFAVTALSADIAVIPPAEVTDAVLDALHRGGVYRTDEKSGIVE